MNKVKSEQPKKWVAYYRVSTQRQGQSGLGLEAQRSSVERYISQHGGELVESFTEVESGKMMRNRPQLQLALTLTKKIRGTLIIAKMDRLARNLHTITTLISSRTDFIAVDNPHATKLTIQILGAVAESERDLISVRTSEAMKMAKARGVKFGETGKILAAKHKAKAMKNAAALMGVMRTIKASGGTKVRDIRDELNRREIPSPGGGRWHLPNTHRLIKRIELIESGGAGD